MSTHLEKAFGFCGYMKDVFGLELKVDTSLEHTKEYCAKDGFFLIDLEERAGVMVSEKYRKLISYSTKYKKYDVVDHGVSRVAILNYK